MYVIFKQQESRISFILDFFLNKLNHWNVEIKPTRILKRIGFTVTCHITTATDYSKYRLIDTYPSFNKHGSENCFKEVGCRQTSLMAKSC